MYYTGRLLSQVQSVKVGDSYGGGIIAYILQSGDPGYEAGKTKGLIAAASDYGVAPWITGGSTQTTLNGNTLTAIGTGAANTAAMAAQTGYTGGAAKACLDYRGGGYSDWYLPSLMELNKLSINSALIGGFINFYYWSSSENNAITAKDILFPGLAINDITGKVAGTLRVRAVRSFTIG